MVCARTRVAAVVVLLVAGPMATAGQGASAPSATSGSQGPTDNRAAWHPYDELQLPDASVSPWIDFLLPAGVFGKARTDLANLRIFDGNGREVPFALRVRRKRSQEQELPAPRESNRVKNKDRSTEVIFDLGVNPPSHHEIDVVTSGAAFFYRPAQLEGCDDAQHWNVLLSNAWLGQYRVESQLISNPKLRYQDCRFRYLRVHVFPDPNVPDDAPSIDLATIYHGIEMPSEYVRSPAILGPRETVTAEAGTASAWTIDLGEDRAPCEKLTLDVADAEFNRPYVLEKVESPQVHWTISQGELQRTAGDSKPVEIHWETEIVARRLRLVVQDQGGAPLQLRAVRCAGPARQVIFARSDELVKPLRLYLGNPDATMPSYPFAKDLPEVLDPAPARATLASAGDTGGLEGPDTSRQAGHGWTRYLGIAAIGVILLGALALFGRKYLSRS